MTTQVCFCAWKLKGQLNDEDIIMGKVRWGILSTAKIARESLIPAIKGTKNAELVAIASRDKNVAKQVAEEFNIPLAFGSYDELLVSKDIDAIYNPLPNHLHVPWSVKAIESQKHVLCEKPLGLNSEDVKRLVDEAKLHPDLVVMEAFMYRFHPQWQQVKELVDQGTLGNIRHIQACFSFFNRDVANVRNQPGIGGGGLMDIGCYCISVARYVFGSEPLRVLGKLFIDPEFGVDVHGSGQMEFASGMATFNCSTQSAPSQLVHIIGEKGSILLETPFYHSPQHPCEIVLYQPNGRQVISVGHHNHFIKEIELFSQAVLDGAVAPTPLSDAIKNMKVIDSFFRSHSTSAWVDV